MKLNPDCIPCFIKQALKTHRLATDDTRLPEKALRETAIKLSTISFESKPRETANQGHEPLSTEYSDPSSTTLAVKDRMLAHDPLGAIYSKCYQMRGFGLK